MTAQTATKIFNPSFGTMETQMALLYAHFNGTSVHFEIDPGSTPNGTPTGSDGFTIRPKLVTETWSLNIRRISSYSNWQLDPNAGFTDSGNTTTAATGASAYAAPEKIGLYPNWLTNCYTVLLEWEDAIMLLFEDPSGGIYYRGCYAGRAIQPFMEGTGVDGLAQMGYTPAYNQSNGWIGSTNLTSYMRVNDSGVEADDWRPDFCVMYPTALSASYNTVGGKYRVSPLLAFGGAIGAPKTQRMYGYFKHLGRAPVNMYIKNRYAPNGGVGNWMAVHYSWGDTYQLVRIPDNFYP